MIRRASVVTALPAWRLRRWLPAVLAASFGIISLSGLAHAQAPAAPAATPVPMNLAPMPAAQPPLTATDKPHADAKHDKLPEEKTVSFLHDDKPWKSVMDWFGKESGLVFVSSEGAIPQGTVTIKTDPNRKYTISGVVDLINEALAPQNFILIRSSQTFTVIPANIKIPQHLIHKISLEELPRKGDTEFVEVAYTLKSLLAEEIVPQLKLRKGVFGNVMALGSNQVIIQDTARNIRLMIKDLETLEDKPGDNLTYTCKFIRAAVAAEKLKTLLSGDGTQVNNAAAAAQQGYPQYGGGYNGGYYPDPRGGRGPSPSASSVSTRFKSVQIDVLELANTIVITAPADKIAVAQTLLKQIDVGLPGQLERKPSPAELKNYPVSAGTAEGVAATLSAIYKNSTVIRITAIPTQNIIMVYAPVDDHFDIAKLVGGTVNAPSTSIFEILPVSSMKEPKDLVDQINRLMPNKGDGATLEPQTDPRPGIIVKGTQIQIEDIRRLLKQIDPTFNSGAPGSNSGGFRVIPVENANSALVAEAIAEALRKTRPTTPVDVKGGLEPNPAPAPAPMATPPAAAPRTGMAAPPRNAARMTQVSYQISDPANPQPKLDPTKKPISITVVGSKIIIACDDGETLELASSYARLFLKESTVENKNLFKVIKLKNNSAEDAAKIISELFNGPPPAAQGGQQGGRGGGSGGLMGGGGMMGMLTGMMGMGGGAQAPATPGRVRIVAEKQSNSIIVVSATPADLGMIELMLQKAIDAPFDATSAEAAKTHFVKLKYANATEVSTTLNTVFSNLTKAGNRAGGQMAMPFNPFMPQQPQAASGAQLTISPDETTNSLIVNCNDSVFAEVSKIVTTLDAATAGNTEVVKVISLEGIDPELVERAVMALNGTTQPAANGQRPGGGTGGMSPFGGGGFSPFGGMGGGGMTGGTRGTGGGGRGTGGGGTRGGGGGGGGTRGGGRQNRAPDFDGGGGGRDFFEYGDKDVPSGASTLFDPEDPNTQSQPTQFPQMLPQGILQAQATQPAPMQPGQPMPKQPGQPGDLGVPRPGGVITDVIDAPKGPVTAEAFPELGKMLLKAANPEDMKLLLQYIEFLRLESKQSQIEVQLVPVKNQDPTSLANLLTNLFSRVQIGTSFTSIAPPTTGNRGSTGGNPFSSFFGGGQTSSSASSPQTVGSIFLLPLPRHNAILLAAPKNRVPDLMKELERLDIPNSPVMKPTAFKLKKGAAQIVAQQLQNFFNQRYPNEPLSQNQFRVTLDADTNTVFVQASPADIKDVADFIEFLESNESDSAAEFKIITLKNASSDEIAGVLTASLKASVLSLNSSEATRANLLNGQLQAIQAGGGTAGGGQGTGATAAPGQFATGGANQLGGQGGNQLGQGGANAAATGGVTALSTSTTKTQRLQFLSGKDGKIYESGLLADVHITPDTRINALVVVATSKTMRLIEKLIDELDVSSAAKSGVKVYTLKRADATNTATLISQLFSRGTGTTGGANANPFAAFQQGGNTANQAQNVRPLLTLTGAVSDGANLVDLRLSVDSRTNSLIVAGSPTDLDTIQAIVAKLEDSEAPQLLTKVYKLRNAASADVQAALQTFLQNTYNTLNTQYVNTTTFQTLQRAVFIQSEPVSNTLLIAASNQYFDEIIKLIEKVDSPPPQVYVQVLIAEVTLRKTSEFGVEIGLQSPVLFARSSTSATAPGTPGYNFNTTAPLPNATIADRGNVGFQGLGNLGVGRSGSAGVGGFVFSAASDTFSLLVRALQAQGRIDVLSRPQLLLTDNQTGFFQVGQSFPVLDGQTVTNNTGITNNITYRDIGITMRVTPRINPDGKVLMRVEPSITNPSPILVSLGNGNSATAFDTQQIQTTVLASNGETVVLGGLIRKSDSKAENKIPVVGDIPWLGAAFRYRTQQQERREIIFIVTPHLVYNEADMARISAIEACKMGWSYRDVMNINTFGGAVLSGQNPYETAGMNTTIHSGAVPQGFGQGHTSPLPGGVQQDVPGMGTPTPFTQPLPAGVVPDAVPQVVPNNAIPPSQPLAPPTAMPMNGMMPQNGSLVPQVPGPNSNVTFQTGGPRQQSAAPVMLPTQYTQPNSATKPAAQPQPKEGRPWIISR